MFSIGLLSHWALSDRCFAAIRFAFRISRSISHIRRLLHRTAIPFRREETINVSRPINQNRAPVLHSAKGRVRTHRGAAWEQ